MAVLNSLVHQAVRGLPVDLADQAVTCDGNRQLKRRTEVVDAREPRQILL